MARPAKEHERMQEQNPAERKKGSGRWWIVGGAGAFVVAAIVATLLVFTGKDEPAVANGTTAPAAATGQAEQPAKQDAGQAPAQLSLPGGGTAKLVQEDLDANGALKIPEGLDEAAWWGAKLGADHGVALLSGHVNWK